MTNRMCDKLVTGFCDKRVTKLCEPHVTSRLCDKHVTAVSSLVVHKRLLSTNELTGDKLVTRLCDRLVTHRTTRVSNVTNHNS